MARVAIRIKGIDDLLEKARRLPDNVREELDSSLIEETYNIQAIARTLAPVDTGVLRSHITAEQLGDLRYQIVARSKYAVFVEEGTRPHFPPIDALTGWVRRVIRPPRREVRRVAYLVARAISRRGTEPRPFMRPAYQERKPMIDQALRDALRRGVQR